MLLRIGTHFELELIHGRLHYIRIPYVGAVCISEDFGVVFDSWRTLKEVGEV